MKKLAAISLCFIFLLSSLGLTLHYHHCPMMGSSVSLKSQAKSCCSKENKKPMGCCSNHSQEIKIKDEFTVSQKSTLKLIEFTSPAIFQVVESTPITPLVKKHFSYHDHSPPERPVSLSILYRSLLI